MLIFRQREFGMGKMPVQMGELFDRFKFHSNGGKAKKELMEYLGPERYARDVREFRITGKPYSSGEYGRRYLVEPNFKHKEYGLNRILKGRKVEDLSPLERKKYIERAKQYTKGEYGRQKRNAKIRAEEDKWYSPDYDINERMR